MRIEAEMDHYIICRGRGCYESFFCFFVDSDSSCWTHAHPWDARTFKTMADAEVELAELKRRATARSNSKRVRP